MKTYVVTPHKNRLSETVLMMGHKICFYGEKWLITPKFSLLPLLNWNTDCKGNMYTSRGSNFAIFIFILCLKGELKQILSLKNLPVCKGLFVQGSKQEVKEVVPLCKNVSKSGGAPIHFNCKFILGINISFLWKLPRNYH